MARKTLAEKGIENLKGKNWVESLVELGRRQLPAKQMGEISASVQI